MDLTSSSCIGMSPFIPSFFFLSFLGYVFLIYFLKPNLLLSMYFFLLEGDRKFEGILSGEEFPSPNRDKISNCMLVSIFP